MKITTLVSDEKDVAYHWRIYNPMVEMRKHNVDISTLQFGDNIRAGTDIMLFPRVTPVMTQAARDTILDYLDYLRAAGIKIVYESDDDVWTESYVSHLFQVSPTADLTFGQMSTVLSQLETLVEGNRWLLSQADAVIVSTPYLKTIVSSITDKQVYVVPNAISITQFEAGLDDDHQLTHPHYITIGWAGGTRPVQELEPMFIAWELIAEEYNNVKFVIAGWIPPNLIKYPKVADNLIHEPWTIVEKYGQGMQVDIGCCIVGDDNFCMSKSVIKAWEYALAGALPIGSSNLYSSEPIPTATTVDDWYKQLKHFVKDYEEREALAALYKNHVKNSHDLASEWLFWPDAFSKILSSK